MRTPFISLFFLLISILSFSQNPQQRAIVNVTGYVFEKESNQPLEYATLVFTPEKGKNITGGITDVKGKFDISVPEGTYTIKVEFFSFKTKTLAKQNITQNMNLGTIILEADVQTLNEVEIIAEKSTVEVKLDKKIYNVGQDMTVKGGTAADVLDNVPSVSVDVEGNVSLRGNESVRILIDGKPSGLVGLSATDALRQLPADAIQKVEVITSPSARYDAEGTAGIINIILRKGKVTGFNASYSLNIGIPENYGASANVNYRSKKFNLFSNFGYNYRNSKSDGRNFNFVNNEENKTSEEIRNSENLRKSFNGNFGMEYFLTDKATVTGSILFRNAPTESSSENNRFFYSTTTYESLRSESTEGKNDLLEYSLNFTKKFKKDDHKWTIDIKYQDNSENNSGLLEENNIAPSQTFVSAENTNTTDSQKDWLIKTDYVLPLGDKNQFEIGFQANLKKLDTDYKVYEFDPIQNQYLLNTDISNLLKNDEDVYSAYVQYGTKVKKLSALFGLRMESTNQIVDGQESVQYPDLNFEKKYTNFFPTMNLTYELSDSENLTLGYNRRIRRPHSHMLNPFYSRSSPTNIFVGNPGLDPVFSNSYDIGYFKKWEKLTLNTSIYYNQADNSFQMIREASGELFNGVPIIYSRPINLNNEKRYGTELSLNYSPIKTIQLSNSFNLFHYKTEGSYNNVNYLGDNFSWFNRFSSKIKFTKKSDFQLTFMYMAPQEDNVSKRKGMFSANAAYSLDVLKDKGTLSLNVSDIFNSRSREFYSYFPEFSSYAKMRWQSRQINLNFTYRFNQKKKPVRPEREDMNGGEEIMG